MAFCIFGICYLTLARIQGFRCLDDLLLEGGSFTEFISILLFQLHEIVLNLDNSSISPYTFHFSVTDWNLATRKY